MPTSFTVVPVKDGEKKAKVFGQLEEEDEDVDDNNVLKEEEESAAGWSRHSEEETSLTNPTS